MSEWEAFVLGALQGVTEFLPVSSSGHLVMAQMVLGVAVTGILFEVTVHVATVISILVAFRSRITDLVRGALAGRREAWRYVGLLVVASLPVALTGLFLQNLVQELFEQPMVPAVALLVTGTFLWSTRFLKHAGEDDGVLTSVDASSAEVGTLGGGRGGPGLREALAMGVAQTVALIPGISRSGATVVTGLWLGMEASEAAIFSFLMGIPAIMGGGLLLALQLSGSESGISGLSLGIGFVVAAVVGVVSIRLFVAALQRNTFHRFGVYCWILGSVFLLYLGLQ